MIRNEVNPARHSARAQEVPVDRRNPSALFIEQEIEADRRREQWLWLKAVVALALVGALIVVRQVFFA
ncbi:MAG: hypothetical protein ABL886_11325 [Rhodoglobus sp.]